MAVSMWHEQYEAAACPGAINNMGMTSVGNARFIVAMQGPTAASPERAFLHHLNEHEGGMNCLQLWPAPGQPTTLA